MTIRRKFRAWWERGQFHPGLVGWLVNPFYLARRALHGHLAELLGRLRGEVLDVGCGTKPYRALVPAARYVGLDYDSALRREAGLADVYYDGGRFPFPDESFDGALCTQVLEHVFTPEAFLAEICRVLRPGGELVLTVPFVWDEHEQPHDFARYSSFGLRAMLERNGFEVLEQRKTLPDARALFQLFNAYLHKVTFSRWTWANRLWALLLMAPVTLLGMTIGRLLPGNPDLFLDNIVLARKPSAAPKA